MSKTEWTAVTIISNKTKMLVNYVLK